MCTLIVLHRCVPGRPLVVAANRDEFLDRPAEGMALRSSGKGPIVAPLDLEAGGTWVGLSGRNVFVGLTNLRAATQPSVVLEADRTLRSRGEVVMMALEAESAAHAIEGLLATLATLASEAESFNPFQLLVADGQDAWLLVYRGEARAVQLEPGPHVVGNVVDERIEAALSAASVKQSESLDSEPRARKLTRIRERVEKLMTEPSRDLFEGLAGICREHVESDRSGIPELEGRIAGEESGPPGRSPFESTCVHVADRYGTRSSLLLELSADSDASRLWTTDGPPCERPYENRSSLLKALGVRQGSRAETETA